MANQKKLQSKDRLTAEGFNRSFGRTSSRLTLEEQAKLDERLTPWSLPGYIIGQPEAAKLELPHAPITLEIGIGNGQALFERAKADPATHQIGIEVYKNGLKSLLHKLDAAKEQATPIKNISIVCDDARDVLQALPEDSVDKVMVLYPDPWPKARHHKRRIVQKEFLDRVHRVLKEDGELFLATDITGYAWWMLREVLSHGGFSPNANAPQDMAIPPKGWVETKYEKKARKEGRLHSWYLSFSSTP